MVTTCTHCRGSSAWNVCRRYWPMHRYICKSPTMRCGTGMPDNELERLWRKLQPLAIDKMPLAEAPPRGSRFGSPLVLSRVHWVRPEIVVEVTYLTWTEDGLLRQVVYLGEREDKPAAEVQRPLPRGIA